MKINWNNIAYLLVFAVVVASGIGWMASAAFTPAPPNPPDCPDNIEGCHTPINVSTTRQDKLGSLSIGNVLYVDRAIEAKNWITVGEYNEDGTPTANQGFLRVNGRLKYSYGVPKAGCVLTSDDATGMSSWQAAPGSSNGIKASDFYVENQVLTANSADVWMEGCKNACGTAETYTGNGDPVAGECYYCTTMDCNSNSETDLGKCKWQLKRGKRVAVGEVMCDRNPNDVAISGSYYDRNKGGKLGAVEPIVVGGAIKGFKCTDIGGRNGTCIAVCLKLGEPAASN
ncbi:MAG: hypothetical protein WCO03_01075 [bacterium]